MVYGFGATDAMMAYARPYALVISIGVPFGIFAAGASYLIRADGSPAYFMLVLLSGAIFLFVFDMGIGGIALAAVGAVSKVMIVLMSCVIGISLGCQTIYGYNYGRKQYGRVKEAYKLAIKYGTVVSVIAFFCIQLFPRQILSIFGSDNPLFYEFAVRYMRIYLFMIFINALQPVTSTFFTSISKAKLGFWMSLIGQVILLISLLLVLPLFWVIDALLLSILYWMPFCSLKEERECASSFQRHTWALLSPLLTEKGKNAIEECDSCRNGLKVK